MQGCVDYSCRAEWLSCTRVRALCSSSPGWFAAGHEPSPVQRAGSRCLSALCPSPLCGLALSLLRGRCGLPASVRGAWLPVHQLPTRGSPRLPPPSAVARAAWTCTRGAGRWVHRLGLGARCPFISNTISFHEDARLCRQQPRALRPAAAAV